MRNFLLFIVFCTIAVLTFAQGDRGSRAVPTHEDEIKNTYALIIGISDYENLQSLQFADQDALAMEDFLSGEWGANIPKENIRLLLNNHAKNGDILENGMTWLYDKVKPGDRAIIYFAGHGISVGNNDAYLLSYNTIQEFNTANIFMSGGIPMLQVKRNFIAPMYQNGVQVLLIIDACRSFDIARIIKE
ncbi:MAG: caspase family protein [Brumimicrobium sp.]|nr:caspase family protein [Brumimicrobium sp.]